MNSWTHGALYRSVKLGFLIILLSVRRKRLKSARVRVRVCVCVCTVQLDLAEHSRFIIVNTTRGEARPTRYGVQRPNRSA